MGKYEFAVAYGIDQSSMRASGRNPRASLVVYVSSTRRCDRKKRGKVKLSATEKIIEKDRDEGF